MEFPFPLLSDADEALCTQFDVIKMKNMYGKQVRGIERSTFVIDGVGQAGARMARRQGRRARAGSARIREDAVTRASRIADRRNSRSRDVRAFRVPFPPQNVLLADVPYHYPLYAATIAAYINSTGGSLPSA